MNGHRVFYAFHVCLSNRDKKIKMEELHEYKEIQ